MLLDLDSDANFIAADKDGAKIGLEQAISYAVYDIDDVEIVEIDVKKKGRLQVKT